MLASFRVFRSDDTFYLQLPRSKVDIIANRLRMYVLRAKARVENASDRLVAIGISGDCAPSLLASLLDTTPERDNEVSHVGDTIAIRISGPAPRFEILGPVADIQTLWDGLATDASVVNADYWALLDIRAGIPNVFPETSEAFVPQMANLQLLDGVSFKKGCYTGQEVVARMQYLGKLKRRMYRAVVSGDRVPLSGDELHCPGSSSEKATGRVVDARPNENGAYELLAVVEIDAAENGEVRLGGADGPLLSFIEPPYGFSPED
jgi:folate-binding protein YgfZ